MSCALRGLQSLCVLSTLLSPSSTLRLEIVTQTLLVISSRCLCFSCEFKHSPVTNMKHKHSMRRGILMRLRSITYNCVKAFDPDHFLRPGPLQPRQTWCFLSTLQVRENYSGQVVNTEGPLTPALISWANSLTEPLKNS